MSMRHRFGCFVTLGLLILALPAGAENPFKRPPYADEKAAVERLFHYKTEGARRVLAWIRHDHAIELIAAYNRDGDIADLEVGLKYARSATELAPDVIDFWRVLAMAALRLPTGELTPLIAESALLRVLEMDPDDRDSRRLLTDLYVGTDQFAEAVPHYLHLLETLPDGAPDFDMMKMAVACLEGEETGRCTIALEKRVRKGLKLVDMGVMSTRDIPAEARVALAILYRAQHLEEKAEGELVEVLADHAAPETHRIADAIYMHWADIGFMADAPDVEDGP